MVQEDLLKQVYRFIAAYIDENGYAPSVREIAAGCYVGLSTAIRTLDILEARGEIRRVPYQARSIVLVEKTESGRK